MYHFPELKTNMYENYLHVSVPLKTDDFLKPQGPPDCQIFSWLSEIYGSTSATNRIVHDLLNPLP